MDAIDEEFADEQALQETSGDNPAPFEDYRVACKISKVTYQFLSSKTELSNDQYWLQPSFQVQNMIVEENETSLLAQAQKEELEFPSLKGYAIKFNPKTMEI